MGFSSWFPVTFFEVNFSAAVGTLDLAIAERSVEFTSQIFICSFNLYSND
jgi:hypothetical protein